MSDLKQFSQNYQQLASMVDVIPDLMLEVVNNHSFSVVVCSNWLQALFFHELPLSPGSPVDTRHSNSQLAQIAVETLQSQGKIRDRILEAGETVLLVQSHYFDPDESHHDALIAMRMHDVSTMGHEVAHKHRSDFFGIVGRSRVMEDIFRRIELYSKTRSNILVTGETGTGKELVAQAIHQLSRFRGNFVALNCTAMSETLIESELFGHERGSFTGAYRSHRGKFERADKGTLFLDEIGDMPLHTQGKLLRVLEDGIVERVGGETSFKVDLRVVAATNVPLEQAIEEKSFRADLFYRLAVLRLHLPPLRQRRTDIPLLVRHFIGRLNQKYSYMNKRILEISHDAMAILTHYPWPGNVRELANVMERIFVETTSSVVTASDLQSWMEEKVRILEDGTQDGAANSNLPQISDTAGLEPAIPLSTRDLTKEHIIAALQRTGGNKTRAAQLLGIDKSTLYRKMKRFSVTF
ncbi:sigma-54 interaction domain-containing protein [Desulfurispira natronophila]|uniref:Transcriptional regulator with PAS, ATPase and Fis domain n=1 Tax=Desulfurispira natronophila TaxID=682562 RepID=A0A7W7Y2J6_9BACT|nr:sigma-54 dependent transcriptional regulator [Desulfurispira natronophila]MBB5020854.1 transcriptional regulator with PAS, ATPase and Fis domain [Desulfurispira natronophila]